jgi:hypothetical protein
MPTKRRKFLPKDWRKICDQYECRKTLVNVAEILGVTRITARSWVKSNEEFAAYIEPNEESFPMNHDTPICDRLQDLIMCHEGMRSLQISISDLRRVLVDAKDAIEQMGALFRMSESERHRERESLHRMNSRARSHSNGGDATPRALSLSDLPPDT